MFHLFIKYCLLNNTPKVLKVTHYFSSNEARNKLNFKPKKYDMKDSYIVEWFKEET